jgi:hypothetical protein
MPVLLVSDTSVLVDLDRAGVLDALFALPMEFAVPDLLYERELRTWPGRDLKEAGLLILALDADGVELAQEYRRRERRLSLPDAFALSLAKTGGHGLLAGDACLREQADVEGVECHGVLWLFDALFEHAIVTGADLSAALRRLAEHPRCWLPRAEVQKRLQKYERTQPGG